MTQATESAPSNNLRIVDLDKMDDLEPGESLADHLTVDTTSTEEASPQSATEAATKIPEKFAGKSVEEIVEAYQNLEKKFGQQGTDLGELRKLTDKVLLEQALQQNATSQSPTVAADPELSDDDFLVNPKETVEKLVESKVKEVTEKLESKDRVEAVKALEEKHPDMVELVQDTDFQEWVLSSPAREVNWAKASQGDFVQADELFSLYKELHAPKETAAIPATTEEPVDQAALETATNSLVGNGSDAASATATKPVYSRRRLVQLQVENPAKYQALAPEITLAYTEGRVVD